MSTKCAGLEARSRTASRLHTRSRSGKRSFDRRLARPRHGSGALSGSCVFLYSTLISHGRPGSYGGTASRSSSASRTPSSISSRALAGVTERAEWAPRPRFTATVVTQGPRCSVPSRHEASSPVTRSTGQPQVPQRAALIPADDRVELAPPFLVERLAASRLLLLDDPGDAFHV